MAWQVSSLYLRVKCHDIYTYFQLMSRERKRKYGKILTIVESKRVVYGCSLNYSNNFSEWGKFLRVQIWREKKKGMHNVAT